MRSPSKPNRTLRAALFETARPASRLPHAVRLIMRLETIMAIDPVCKMTVDENKAAGKSEYNGKTYYFCAAVCKTRFDREPEKYVKPA